MTSRVRVLVAVIACLSLSGFVVARAGLPGVPGVPAPPIPKVPQLPSLPIPDVTQLLSGEDAVSTTFADAVPNIPFLNNYQPAQADYLDEHPRTADSGYDVPSGSYIFDSRSYCLHAGKHGSVTGTGYQWAPIKGSKAQIIETILQKSADHLEIPQQQIQQLLWAIQARARFSNLSPELQADAAKLLTPVQILTLNQSAIGIVPDNQLQALLSKIPDPLQAQVQAENSLRSMLTSNQSYADMERVAVLPPLTQRVTNLPPVRWSFAPSGYFVWFLPAGYWHTTMVIDVPGAVTASQDALGRVTGLQDRHGDSISLSYDASRGGAVSVEGDPQTRLYKIDSMRFLWQQLVNGKQTVESETVPLERWVAVGVPNGKGHATGPQDAQTLYQNAQSLSAQFDSLLSSIHGTQKALPGLVAVAQVQQALDAAKSATPLSPGAMQLSQFPYEAWESAFAHSVGGRIAAEVDAGQDQPMELGFWLAMPDFADAQRLAQSPVPQQPEPPEPCPQLPPHEGNGTQQMIASGLSDGGYPGAAKDSSQISYDQLSDAYFFEVNLDAGGNPIAPCKPGVYKIKGVVFSQEESHGPVSWTDWYSAVSIYNSGILAGQGTATSGEPGSPGSAEQAIAAAAKDVHPIPK